MFGLEYIRQANGNRSGRQSIRSQLAGVEYVGKPKRVANNTVKYVRPDGTVCYRLHNTDVVSLNPDGTFTLNSDGWHTVTTKDRINRYAPVRLYQKKHEWFIGDGTPYEDGMTVDVTGKPVVVEAEAA